MHRVVIMRDGPVRARQVVPFTMTAPQGSPDPRDLWKYLTNYEEKTGGEVLAIAHNGNLSNGIMFPLEAQWNGKKLDETYVTQRANGSRSTRRPRSRATARRTPSFRRTTSSLITRPGRSATSTSAKQRPTTCLPANMPARR